MKIFLTLILTSAAWATGLSLWFHSIDGLIATFGCTSFIVIFSLMASSSYSE